MILTMAFPPPEHLLTLKVQRPGVVEMIAMDVFILRYMAAVLRRVGRLNTDVPALVDEWSTSLFR